MESSTPSHAKGIFSHGQIQHTLEAIHSPFPHFKHEQHGPIVNVNEVVEDKLTMGQRIADNVASTVGSWRFIIIQSSLLALWIIINCIAWISHWDPYPFILLNLALSFQAAYTGPFVMNHQDSMILQIVQGLQAQSQLIEQQDKLILQIVERADVQHQQFMQQREELLKKISQIIPAETKAMLNNTSASGESS